MSSQTGAREMLELVESLKGLAQDFAAREEKLSQEHQIKVGREHQRRDEAIEELTGKLNAQIAEADAALQSAKDLAKATLESRKTRIARAARSAKEQALKHIESQTGSRKYELQKQMMQAEPERDAGFAAAASAWQVSKDQLAAEHDALVLLEKKACAAFNGYGAFRRWLARASKKAEVDPTADENQLIAEIPKLLGKAREDLARFGRIPIPLFFRFLPVWILLLLGSGVVAYGFFRFGRDSITFRQEVEAVVAVLAVISIVHFIGRRQSGPLALAIATALGKARRMHDACLEKADARYQLEFARIEQEYKDTIQRLEEEWNLALTGGAEGKEAYEPRIVQKELRLSSFNNQLYRARLDCLEKAHAESLERLTRETEAEKKRITSVCEDKETKLNAENQTQWRELETSWKSAVQPIYEAVNAATGFAQKLFPAWDPPVWADWKPPSIFEHTAKFAQMDVDVSKLCDAVPQDPRLALPGPSRFSAPLLLTYPAQGSILFETINSGRDDAIAALNNIILRLLSTAPPGRLSFTIIDPIGLGQNFAGVMHLADYEEQLINSRIWTQTSQIEQKLADLNEHMEKVIQMYLRNEYDTIAEYNEQAGNLAEKYHFLVIADFPVNFSDTAARRLMSIATSGARCGVYTLIHWDHRQPAPPDFMPAELRKSGVSLSGKGGEFMLTGKFLPGTKLLLDSPPAPDFTTEFIHKVGRMSVDSSRVEVPFPNVAPTDQDLWTLETSTELRVAIGRTGATKLQYLAIGKGTRQHALIAGKTGSGKSTLFHVIITNLALWCSPEQVEFYLVDFKKGVEFKCYAAHHLPHARVVAIESDREFGLSVLQRVDDELKRRGDLFRKLGVQDIAGYKRAGGAEAMPRSLLLVDEFQEFFVEEDKISQSASVLLDRIVRQGRAFGIHVLLGSQTLGGAYTVARTTLGQMVIRIALQCNEADAYLIMDDSNPAPRLLSRPGEGIYNDAAGAVEGNSPFQVVWLADDVRDAYLAKVQERAAKSKIGYPGPIVFEGNAPADVRENQPLQALLQSESIRPTVAPRIWLGAPNAIKGPTEAVFHRQSGNNLLIVGQRDEAALAIMSVALISLAAQYPAGAARFFLFDGNPPGSPHREFLDRIVQAIPHPITTAKHNDLPQIMNGLAEELKKRSDDEHAGEAPPNFLFFHGLQKFGKLRHEEDFGFSGGESDAAANPGAQLTNIISEGARLGFHVIATCDTYNNVNRFLSRKAFSEFEMRVLFQMSANDSASLIDSPKAGALGLHRALFYNEQEGWLETFRPYALPGGDWIEQTARNLSRLLKRGAGSP